ncbi:metallophosphoesterase [Nocardia beijingensis]|uniref:metallophosphoesterase n=1 Tax=Nocardia beijingensis TaxID=95162 RepID=UPI002B4B8D67|nr:metallophosphoesterase [Nocardia beijingensis]
MVVKSVLIGVAVLGLVGVVVLTVVGAHWYVWRRLVRDTTAAGTRARRVGTAIMLAGPLLLLGTTVAELASAPFVIVRIIAWPGYLWGALFVYLLLALAIGEPIRLLALRRFDEGRAVREPDSRADIASESALVAVRESPSRVGSAPEPPVGVCLASEAPGGPGFVPASPIGSGSESAVESDGVHESLVGGGSGPESSAGGGFAAGTELAPRTSPDTAAPAESSPARLPRRVFVSRVMGGAAVAAAATTVGVGAYGVLNGPSVMRVAVPLAKLPRGADGFRIAVVSDVHLGPILGRGFAERVVRTINDTLPDLIAVVGDLVDGSVEHLRSAVEPLAGLRARHGAFFVTGNHEYFSGAEQWVEHVQELGMHLLANARTELPGFDLAGVNDVQGERTGQGPDFGKALGDRDRARAAVLLAHQPVLIDDAVAHGVDLQLSGHTHGGQLWPGNYLAGLANPTVAGLERYGDTQLYVSRGAGAWGPPVRVGAPSDITVVELVSLRA